MTNSLFSSIALVPASVLRAHFEQQERKMERIIIADRQTSAGKLVVTSNDAGHGFIVILDGKEIPGDPGFGPARGLPKQYAGKYSHMLVTSKGNVLLTPSEASIITKARDEFSKRLAAELADAESAAMNSADPRIRRAALASKERDTYDQDAFPGSKRWLENKKWADALARLDRENPDLVAELESKRKEKIQRDYDALSDFVKMGS